MIFSAPFVVFFGIFVLIHQLHVTHSDSVEEMNRELRLLGIEPDPVPVVTVEPKSDTVEAVEPKVADTVEANNSNSEHVDSEFNTTQDGAPLDVAAALVLDPNTLLTAMEGAEARFAFIDPALPLPEIWAGLTNTSQGDRLHHSDECDPNVHTRLFNKLMNLPASVITATELESLQDDIRNTCDWERSMTCDPMRHRCVCSVDSIWLKTDNPLQSLISGTIGVGGSIPAIGSNRGTHGQCVLLAGSKCYASEDEHKKDSKNPLGLDPPYAPCLNGTSCQDGICKCTQPGTQECEDAENIFRTGVTQLMKQLKEFKWAGHDEPCDIGSMLTIDFRIHTLRSLTIISKSWKELGVSFERICDIHQGLECYPDNGDRRARNGSCKCNRGFTWYQDTCKGEHGSLCETRIWAEGDAVTYQSDIACMPELNCTKVKYLGTETRVGACCYTGIYKYRAHEMNQTDMYLCSKGFCSCAVFVLVVLLAVPNILNF